MERSVANDKRDLASAELAAARLGDLTQAVLDLPPTVRTESVEIRLEELKATRKQQAEALSEMFEANKAAHAADEKTKQAGEAHAAVLAWSAIADALAPDGIPGEMLVEALEPINERLSHSANEAQWIRVGIERDMSITAGNDARPYALLSESEKWRVDAMIAEAVAHLSGLRVLLLDRFDVLDLQGREDLLYWLDDLAAAGTIETALLFGTLKALPAGLPETIGAVWVSNGMAGQTLKEAA
jgi:hypothetical protein